MTDIGSDPNAQNQQGQTLHLSDVSVFNQPNFQFQFQTELNQEAFQAKQIIDQIAKHHDLQHEQINKMQQLQKQLLQSGQEISDDIVNQQYLLNEQINTELKELLKLNRTIILDPSDLHKSRILGQRLQIQQQGLNLLIRELAQKNSSNPTDSFVFPYFRFVKVNENEKALDDFLNSFS